MNFLDKALSRFGYVPRKRVVNTVKTLRAYAAASINRLTGDWSAAESSLNYDIKSGISAVRARARDLMKNNDYAKKYRNLVRTNVLNQESNGFKLQMNCGEFNQAGEFVPDKLASKKIEQAWLDWSKREHCSASGVYSFRAIQDTLLTYLCRDGEGAVRFVRDKKSKYGLKLQIVPPEMVDEKLDKVLENGNIIRMGVEFNAWNTPVAYWLWKDDPARRIARNADLVTRRDHERVPAEDMILGFDREEEGQARGISWLVQSMVRLKMLGDYEYAALINAKAAASKMGFFTTPAGEVSEGFQGEGTDAAGSKQMDIEPGTFEELPAGMDFKPWDPNYPSDQHGDFMKVTLQGVSAGLGVAYASLSGNLSDANYSSNRVGMLDERELWKTLQQWFTETFITPIFEAWLESALLSGAINLPFKWEKFNRPYFVGRRWSWIDPKNDVESKIAERRFGITTLKQIHAENGDDFDEMMTQLAEENAQLEKVGINFKEEPRNVPVKGEVQA